MYKRVKGEERERRERERKREREREKEKERERKVSHSVHQNSQNDSQKIAKKEYKERDFF